MKKRSALWVAVALAALPVLYVLRNQEVITLDEAYRRASPESRQFVRLSDGITHYESVGRGDPVVLIHGVSGPMMVWDPVVPELARAGHRVIRYDLYGRGLSDRIDGHYDLPLYLRQLDELLAALNVKGPVTLMGSSMGAIIASEFTRLDPHRVARVALVGPAGFPLEASPLARLMGIPLVGEYVMGIVGDRALRRHNRNYFFAPAEYADYQRRFEEQLRIKGSKRAILSTMRHVPLQKYVSGFKALAKTGKPVLIVWGKEDRAFPFRYRLTALNAIPHGDLVAVSEAGHLPQVEKPEAVVPELKNFLRPRLAE